jgi:hypothetical protein
VIIRIVHIANTINQELRQVHIKVAPNITLADVERDIVSVFHNQPHIHWPADPDVPTEPVWESHLVKLMTS